MFHPVLAGLICSAASCRSLHESSHNKQMCTGLEVTKRLPAQSGSFFEIQASVWLLLLCAIVHSRLQLVNTGQAHTSQIGRATYGVPLGSMRISPCPAPVTRSV